MSDDKVLDLGNGGTFVNKATDPVISPSYALPADFAAQYPQPLDPTEIIAMCEDVTLWQTIPELRTGLKQDMWREMTALAFTSGSAYIAFADGACPEEYTHDGSNTTITLKNIGTKKTLGISDIIHSAAVATGYGDGINRLLAPMTSGEGMPGGSQMGTFFAESVADLKEKEMRLGLTLVMNGWNRLLAEGDSSANALEFDGIETWQTNNSVTFNTNSTAVTGTFSAASFDRFLAEGCAKPDTIMGHPQAIQEMLSGYFQLGFAGSQVVNYSDGSRITPGFNFAGFVNTGAGRMRVIADSNFNRTTVGSTIQADLWTMRMVHNGEPLVYRRTQIPLGVTDLAPGCTAIAFQLWAKTALVIKHACAHGQYTSWFTGRIVSTCPVIG